MSLENALPSLNPCFSGSWFQSPRVCSHWEHGIVLILVLVEVGFKVRGNVLRTRQYLSGLNPCFIGSWFQRPSGTVSSPTEHWS